MDYCFVRMITGQNMENLARIVDRYGEVNIIIAVYWHEA
jgi:hypothetical protein